MQYHIPDNPRIVLWDLPGGGTLEFPETTYFEGEYTGTLQICGLRVYDVSDHIIILTSS